MRETPKALKVKRAGAMRRLFEEPREARRRRHRTRKARTEERVDVGGLGRSWSSQFGLRARAGTVREQQLHQRRVPFPGGELERRQPARQLVLIARIVPYRSGRQSEWHGHAHAHHARAIRMRRGKIRML